jgi:hypothetical protein
MMLNPEAGENNLWKNCLIRQLGLYLFHDNYKNILWLLFLLLLFWKEAGYAFVEKLASN